ncbi:Teneurin-3, partial [Durusdinium trenchii]
MVSEAEVEIDPEEEDELVADGGDPPQATLDEDLEEAAECGLDSDILQQIEESVETAAEALLTMREAKVKLQEVKKDRGYGRASPADQKGKMNPKKQSSKHPCFDCNLPGHWAGDPECTKPGQGLGRKNKQVKQVKVTEALNTEVSPPVMEDGGHEVLAVGAFPMTNEFVAAFEQSHLHPQEVNVAGKLSADKMLVGALDSACNRTCTGTEWLNNYLRCLRDAPEEVRGLVKSHKEYETFKFGNGGTQVSVARWRLPMQLDGSIICFWTALVPVPSLGLLLGRDFLEAIGADMHFAHRTLRCEHLTGKPISLKQLAAGHFLLPLVPAAWSGVGPQRWKRLGVDGVLELQLSPVQWLQKKLSFGSSLKSSSHDHLLTEQSVRVGHLVCAVLRSPDVFGSSVQAQGASMKPEGTTDRNSSNLLGGESANMDVKVGRWKRMFLRMGERFRWAAKGLLLWLLQRPYLRYLPLPYPSTTTTAAWLAQVCKQVSDGTIPPRYLKNCLEKNLFTMSNLAECRHLRNRVGLRTSFIEDPVLAGMMAAQTTKGITAKLRSAAQKEAKELAKKAEADGSREQEIKEKVKPMIEILKNKKPAISPAKANTAEEISASSSSPPARLFNDNPKNLAVQQQEMRAMMEQMSRELALLRSQVTPEMEVDLSSEPSLIPDSPQDASPVNFTEAEIRELNGQAYEELYGANLTAQFGDDIPAEVMQEIRLGLRDGAGMQMKELLVADHEQEMLDFMTEETFFQPFELCLPDDKVLAGFEALQNESQPKNVLISKNVKPPDKERSLVSEVYTTSQNVMREAERRGHKVGPAMSLDNGWNFLLAEHRSRAMKVLEEEKPYCVVLAFPCGPFSPLQYLNTRGLTSLDQRQADGSTLKAILTAVIRAHSVIGAEELQRALSEAVATYNQDVNDSLPAAPPVALPEEPEETAMPMTPALQPPVQQRGVPGADLPPVRPEELVQVAQQAAPIPSMFGSSALPSRRISDATGMGPAPGSPVPELIRRAGTAGSLLARQIAQARDLAEESGGMKRPAEVDVEALAEQSAFDGARSSPSAPSGVNESLVVACEKGEDELMKQLQHGKEHPLRVIASLADIDKQQPLDAKVKDHGSWGGRWDLPSRSEWQLHQKLGWSWPTGSHDAEALLASAAHKELFWRNMSPEEKIAFREAAKDAWKVWEDNQAIEVLPMDESEAIRKRLRLNKEDMDESYLHRILASGRWCYTFNQAYVKQGKPSRKQLALSSSSAALDGEPLNEALPVFAFLQQLAESPGWHHKGDIVTHVAHHARSYRSPIGRYEIEKYPIRTTYARFDLDTGISHWRILEDHVKMRSLTNRQALLSTPARVLISIFTDTHANKKI